jgi:hypothetical protein
VTIYTRASADASDQLQIFATGPTTAEVRAANPLVALTVRPDDDCSCGEGVAVLKAAPPPHVAELVCVGCQRHRGWLPIRARDFILETINKFGRPHEPIAYRRGISSPEGHLKMKKFDNTNRGSLFSNKQDKRVDTDPDFSGSININGVDFTLKGGTKVGKQSGTKFISLSVRPKNADKPKPAFDDDVGF